MNENFTITFDGNRHMYGYQASFAAVRRKGDKIAIHCTPGEALGLGRWLVKHAQEALGIAETDTRNNNET